MKSGWPIYCCNWEQQNNCTIKSIFNVTLIDASLKIHAFIPCLPLNDDVIRIIHYHNISCRVKLMTTIKHNLLKLTCLCMSKYNTAELNGK